MSPKPELPHSVFWLGEEALVTSEAQEIAHALYDAIPDDEVWRLLGLPTGYKENGGTVRMSVDKLNVIASYNNTRANEQEIVDWFERALVGIHTEGAK